MNILEVIAKDHVEFRRQLAVMTKTAMSDPKKSTETFTALHDHLVAHHEAEEHVLFPELERFEGAKSDVEEAWEEHRAIGLYIEKIKQSHKTERWEAKVAVLKEMVEHHLKEEEDKVFAAARKNLGDEAENLGNRFEALEQKRLSN